MPSAPNAIDGDPPGPPPLVTRGIWGLYRNLVDRIDDNPRRAACILLVACLPALFLTAKFFGNVHAGLEELLPKSAPSVRALEKIHSRIGSQSSLFLIVTSPDAANNRRFTAEIGRRLESRRIPEARIIQSSCAVERKWLSDHAPLLLPDEKFAPLADELEAAIDDARAAANPLFVDLSDNSETREQRLSQFEKRLDQEVRGTDRFPNGYFELPDGSLIVTMIWLRGSELELEPSTALFGAVRDEVNALRREYPSNLRVSYSGEVMHLIEEHDAILADLSLSSVVVLFLVNALIALYFRSVRAVATVLLGLVPGLLFTFAISRLTIGHLNSNTAFLGSIIGGNGINYPILFLAFYRLRSPEEPRRLAIWTAARQALPGTLAAAVTASAAYGGLAASTFRGFSQFGWIGGVGMVTTWLMMFITMPIAIGLLSPPRHGRHPTKTQAHLLSYFRHRWLPHAVAAAVLVTVVIGTGFGVKKGIQDGLFEMDMRALLNRDSQLSGSASWNGKLGEVFGSWMNPLAAIVDDPVNREAAAEGLRAVLLKGDNPVAQRVETIDLYVPVAAKQEVRLARLKRIAKSLAKIPREEIPEKARAAIDTWFADSNLRPITIADVPVALKQGFVERDGDRADRVVLIFPNLAIDYNDGRNIIQFANVLRTASLPPGTTTGGSFLFMAEIIRLVTDEATHVVLVVCLLVGAVMIPFFLRKPLRIPLVVTTVTSVAISAQAVMIGLGVRVNMLNFAAVPITIGIGSDYVVNLLGAMDALKVDARQACASMGSAILLCSLTTIFGYLSLVMAQSGALRTFGWAAVLGEFMAVSVVLLVLPLILSTRSKTAPNEAT